MILRQVAGILFIWLLAVAYTGTALAHGGGTARLINAEAGPYRLFAWTQPEPLKAGEIHVSLAVTLAATETDEANRDRDIPVTDADLTLHFRSLATGEQFSVRATPEEDLGGFYYEADAQLATDGQWQVEVEVIGDEGQGRAEFVSEALPAGSRNWMLLGGAGAGLIVIIGLAIGLFRLANAPSNGDL